LYGPRQDVTAHRPTPHHVLYLPLRAMPLAYEWHGGVPPELKVKMKYKHTA